MGGHRAHGDHDIIGCMLISFRFLFDRDAVRIDQGCRADDEVDAVSYQLVLNYFLFCFDDMIAALGEILEGNIFFDPIAGAVEIALTETGKEHHRFAQ